MKTVKEWIELIKDDEIRERALKNCDSPNSEMPDVNLAIKCSFKWEDSPEGHEYWENIAYNEIELNIEL